MKYVVEDATAAHSCSSVHVCFLATAHLQCVIHERYSIHLTLTDR